MANLNQVTLIGNMTRDLELTYTPKGAAVGKSALAVNHHWTSEAGEKKERVDFFDFQVWNKSAETLAQYTAKGSPICLVGKLRQETWDDKNTKQKRSRVFVLVESFQFLGSKKEGEAGGAPQRTEQAPNERRQEQSRNDPLNQGGDSGGPDESGDSVPF